MSRPLPPAVLLGGEWWAVSAARSLAAIGVTVHAVGDSKWDPVSRSRSCAAFTNLERAGEEARLDWFRHHGPRGGVVLPCYDDWLEFVARHRGELVELGYVPAEANDAVLLDLLDKGRTYELARGLGIGAPRTVTVRSAADAERAGEEIGFPCALKPLHSHRFAQHFPGVKVWVIRTHDELARTLRRMVELGLEMLVTEIVPGPDDAFSSYYSYLDEDGRPLFAFTKRKLRQFPIEFGLGSYHLTAWDEETAALGLRLFQGVGLRGLGNVEFKRDARDGTLKVMDCNPRLTGATELVRLAGIDLAVFTYSRLAGRPTPSVDSFREGLYLWHPVEDVRALLAYRRSGQLTIRSWARSLLHRQHFPLWSWSDPKPALWTYRYKLARLRRRVAAA